MDLRTKKFLKNKFRDYYQTATLDLPSELPSREWGFISYDSMPETIMYRHKAFGAPGEVRDYLVSMQPAHVYHSVAYYQYPDAPSMKEKNWLGADLIFDLDADHLPGAPQSYAEMLEMVKTESLRLLDFLTDDFGFPEDSITAVFSGGRGYHFHIEDKSVRELESPQRREIVDYVAGKGIDVKYLYKRKYLDGDSGTGTTTFRDKTEITSRHALKNPKIGWSKRITEYVASYLEEEMKKEKKDRFQELKKIEGFGKKAISRLEKISDEPELLEYFKETGRFDFGTAGNQRGMITKLVEVAIEEKRIHLFNPAQVDEPVTADIKRLIRLPGSLHGGSGMRVVTLGLDEIENFEPLSDAVVFSERAVTIKVMKPFGVQMKGIDLQVEEGVQQVPEYAAIYLMCRGVAEYGSK
ncbi:DNA primase small subunit [Methanohalophilus levihalophilus]|uniref:DNA primase catalytic subunit PriS n=1 Tax=Methanohalophilus levihalophilus TaxID=1431282 RepID=UPI001AE1694C|nr:DNA primase catalytic subunit PriS [Methanohalophilus levihalophilus]MBP2030872.1 DNA primase small subunit [Methanohalophilus levihalophilus]